ncbi:MAG TPA: DUF4350 domain-containing protein [Polyangiaceae bacterium]|nr:DUF4350 domain-containing protein [Polyangiaceae bacterium]
MNEVEQAQLDKSLQEAFSDGPLPYCHDKTYRLKYSEHWLCSLSKADQQRCPAFKEQCGVSVKPDAHESDSDGLHVAPWIGAVAEVLFWGLVATLVVALVLSLLRLRKRQKDVKDEAEERNSLEPDVQQQPAAAIAGDKDVQRLLDRARRAAERGDLAAAIDAAHAAAVQGLSAAGHVELDRDRTNGDYLRDLRKAPPLQQEFKVIVGQVEVAQFGGAVPSRGAFDRLLDQVMALLRRLAVLSLLLLPLSLLGCGAQHGGGDQDRGPAGLYVFKHLLADQGAKVHMRLLPLSKLDAGVGVIVAYDAELEEPEQKRVLDWVRRGGKLVVVGNSEFSEAGEVERSMQGCGAMAERGPNQELLPLKLAVIGEDSLRLAPKPESIVPQRVDVTCGGHPYIVTSFLEEGSITFMPERELLTNASLSVADNARLVAELVPADEGMIELVGPWTGDGSQSPMQSLKSAGLMPVILQLFALALLLALRQGTSFGARRDVQTRSRRAFADHVRAVASTYARANAGRLASGHYGLLLIDQLRERTCPGQRPTLLQLAAAIARRVRRPENQIVELLVEAKTAFEEQGDGQGVNHKLVRELEQLSSQAGGIS